MRNPSLFVSHGPPTIAREDVPARAFLATLSNTLQKPKAILAVSAHWMTEKPMVTANPEPETIHDFYGFPDWLYQTRYAAPGSPHFADRVCSALRENSLECDLDPDRGLDHGTWTPLSLIYPDADIPVIQLSIQPNKTPAWHTAIGKSLRPLRNEGLLILASGNTTHNLAAWRQHRHLVDGEAPTWVSNFADWLSDKVTNGATAEIEAYEAHEHGLDNHPSPDHFYRSLSPWAPAMMAPVRFFIAAPVSVSLRWMPISFEVVNNRSVKSVPERFFVALSNHP